MSIINDASRARKTYSFFRSPPANIATTLVSGSGGIVVTGDKTQIVIDGSNIKPSGGALGSTYSWVNTAQVPTGISNQTVISDPAGYQIPSTSSGIAEARIIFKDNVNQKTAGGMFAITFKNVSGTLTINNTGGGALQIWGANDSGFNVLGGGNVFSGSGQKVVFLASQGGSGGGNTATAQLFVSIWLD